MKLRTAGVLLALVGALIYSAKAIIVKLSYRYGVDAVTVIMLRMLFALPICAFMAWWAGRGKVALSGRDWFNVVWLGALGYYLGSFLDFLGLQYISASLERLILYLTPTLVLLMGWLMYRRPITAIQVYGTALSYVGVFMVFGFEATLDGRAVLLGASLVFASAVAYAVYLVYCGEIVQRLGAMRLASLATCVACVCCIVQFFVLRDISVALAVPVPVVWLSLLNATVCTALPVVMIMMAVEKVGPGLTSQIGMVGPLATVFMGVLLLDEPFTGWLVAGTVLVMLGIYVVTRTRAD
ncbi:MAG: DMT family transporter [Burkholderiaceae bacterium]|nr:DMT family transporter [Burkholderiaceae bacterium]MDO9089372.1 DMT family transporter [Burkholderiaceae bacterium]